MATKKVKEKVTSVEHEEPKDVSAAEATEIILRAAMSRNDLGVPTLIGPTHWGKTVKINEIAKQLYENVYTSNLQLDLPEEIGGYPINTGGEISYCTPPMLPKNWKDGNYVLFFDEVDKAQRDTLSGILTLFAERRIRRCFLPENVGLAAAMNEPQVPLPEPLLARMLLLPWPPRDYVLSDRRDFARWKKATELHPVPEVRLPEIPASPAAWHKISRWMTIPEFNMYPTVRKLVLQGLAPPNLAQAYDAILKIDTTVTGVDWAMKLPINYIIANMIPLICKAFDLKDFELECMSYLDQRAFEDTTGELRRVLDVLNNHGDLLTRSIGYPENIEENQKKLLEFIATEGKKND